MSEFPSKSRKHDVAFTSPFDYSNFEDSKLVQMAMAGDQDAFSMLMERYSRVIVAIASSKIGNRATVEDVVQETFIEAFQKLNTIRSAEKFRAWLVVIAYNKVNAHYRTSKAIRRDNEVPLVDEIAFAARDTAPNPREELISSGTTALVISEIVKLNTKIADVVYMRLIEELSSSEISKRLQIKESTTRMRLKRGLSSLRIQMQRHGYSPNSKIEDNE